MCLCLLLVNDEADDLANDSRAAMNKLPECCYEQEAKLVHKLVRLELI